MGNKKKTMKPVDMKGHNLRHEFLPSLQNKLVHFGLCLGREKRN